jgi:hypothetical protein
MLHKRYGLFEPAHRGDRRSIGLDLPLSTSIVWDTYQALFGIQGARRVVRSKSYGPERKLEAGGTAYQLDIAVKQHAGGVFEHYGITSSGNRIRYEYIIYRPVVRQGRWVVGTIAP